MMKHIQYIFILALLSSSFSANSQDDNWWKKLFKKETVEEIETDEKNDAENKSDSTIVAVPAIDESSPSDSNDSLAIPIGLVKSDSPGLIVVNQPYPLDSLGDIYKEKTIRGYRIQIYFGDLEGAKKARSSFVSKRNGKPCYIELRAPSYSVVVGDYRDQYEAHQNLFQLKEEFPNALIVETEITP